MSADARGNIKMKTYEKELPSGYTEALVVDAKNKATAVIMNVVALAVTAVIIAVAVIIIRPVGFLENYSIVRNLFFLFALVIYIVLHEVVHGIAYKLLTGQKLTFGLTLSVAYCGVPDIYVYRTAALIAVLAPFCVFTVVFGAGLLLIGDMWDKLYTAVLFGLHIGGCVGDLYAAALYLFKLRDPLTLMRDTGPKQTFYTK